MSGPQTYLALARKYRPTTFNELIGQEVVVQTLSNAIKNNRLHHAYILTGIRGVGKTTTARIIAKVINCLDRAETSAISCEKCKNCESISAGNNPDVIEIDAASRTGVDDVREIIESSIYSPILSKNKIYIIDEVHMLSNNAFNALLKTLEEPPAHLKFIFATTEIRKVPITVLSRCQKFNLRRLDEKEIASHLKNILSKEGFSSDEESLNMIARASEGSVRDSLSLLDQALSLSNYDGSLKSDLVASMLGISDKNKSIELVINLLKGDFKTSLSLFSQIYESSSNIQNIIHDMMEIIHQITKTKLTSVEPSEEYSAWQKKEISDVAQTTSLACLARLWQMMIKGNLEIQTDANALIIAEMLLARICYLSSIIDETSCVPDLVLNAKKHAYKGNAQTQIPSPDAAINTKESATTQKQKDDIMDILLAFPGSKTI